MEDFVTYSQAVQLKELGFDWKVRACYRRKLILDDNPHCTEPKFIHNDTMRKRWTTNYNDNRCGGGTGKYYYSAPTLAQAAKWLREVKGVDITIGHIYHRLDAGDKVMYGLHIGNQSTFKTEFDMNYGSYEEALSAGITQALQILTYKTERK